MSEFGKSILLFALIGMAFYGVAFLSGVIGHLFWVFLLWGWNFGV